MLSLSACYCCTPRCVQCCWKALRCAETLSQTTAETTDPVTNSGLEVFKVVLWSLFYFPTLIPFLAPPRRLVSVFEAELDLIIKHEKKRGSVSLKSRGFAPKQVTFICLYFILTQNEASAFKWRLSESLFCSSKQVCCSKIATLPLYKYSEITSSPHGSRTWFHAGTPSCEPSLLSADAGMWELWEPNVKCFLLHLLDSCSCLFINLNSEQV